jgi:probable DNA metabolism protein
MTRFVYDGSFDGFLCAASRALREGAIARAGDLTPELFCTDELITTSDPEARELEARLMAAAGGGELETLLFVHACESPDAPDLLLRYVRLTLAAGASVAGDVARPEVFSVRRIRDQVGREINRFLGFVRFRKITEGFYYSRVEPDSDIVGFLGPHFVDRFPDRSFLIHDAGRDIGFWHAPASDRPALKLAPLAGRGPWGLADLSDMPVELSAALERDREPLVESLWREYFRAIAIKERTNPRLQARLMPRRYWKNLVEMEGPCRCIHARAAKNEGEARGFARVRSP